MKANAPTGTGRFGSLRRVHLIGIHGSGTVATSFAIDLVRERLPFMHSLMVVQDLSEVANAVRRQMSFVCDNVPTLYLSDSRVEGLPEVLVSIGQRRCEEVLVILAQNGPFHWGRTINLFGVDSPAVAALPTIMSIDFRTGEVSGLMMAA